MKPKHVYVTKDYPYSQFCRFPVALFPTQCFTNSDEFTLSSHLKRQQSFHIVILFYSLMDSISHLNSQIITFFLLSDELSKSFEFSNSNCFSLTDEFSKSSEFSHSKSFEPTEIYSKKFS